ncbi:hypothetical protein [Deinococcus actinosclerus]|uniref:Uncharacterized protein n=1 Tax=Deinococcus actinosclerus TaxID=1768108 RepID=A0ABN4K932_9DEIO|nr:hypothetical protein [Deinococcus actinosclerus]ALW89645.1 hypothetical protein AUC44_12655 [Deinococcus actinosclerus]
MKLSTTPKARPAHALAFLARAGLGEIVVRRAGHLIERRYYPLPTCTECRTHVDPGTTLCWLCIEARR